MEQVKKALLVLAGSVCVALGAAGAVLPVLPTTPFLLLAAACYARSSRRFHDWLLGNRLFGPYIRNYREGRGISRRHKIITLGFLWVTIGYSAGVAVTHWPVRIMLVAIACAVTLHVVRIRTTPPA